jgi:hypothetical protein
VRCEMKLDRRRDLEDKSECTNFCFYRFKEVCFAKRRKTVFSLNLLPVCNSV